MERAQVQPATGENGQIEVPGADTDRQNPRFRLSGLQFNLIFPYVILTLILASIGIFIITRLVVDSNRERLSNSVLNDSKITNDGMVQTEKLQLDKLRFLVFTSGMAQAVYDHNADLVRTLMEPNFTNATIDMMTAIDLQGKEIITFGRDPDNKELLHEQNGTDFSHVSIVQKVIKGEADEQGDKFVEIIPMKQGAVLFTSAPIRDSAGQTVGVMMVGTYLKNVIRDIKGRTLSDIIITDMDRNLIASTLTGQEEGFDRLFQLAPAAGKDQKTGIQETTLDQRPYLVAFSALTIRKQQVGWIGVIRDSDYLVTQTAQSRNLFILLFTCGTLAVIITGYLLAQSLARPLLRLRNLTKAVAAGDLSQSSQLKRSDEIGELSDAFDTMTLHLRERTEEAARLYAESLQRNRELAEINARLESTQLQLIQSEKLASIGQLTAGIVHDVKNPFAVIMGMAEVLGDDDSLDETMKHGLKTIRDSAIKGNTIVSDLLKFSRQSQPEMRTMDLRETVQTSLRLTAYITRQFELITRIPETPLMVTYDAQQIEQVVINMLHNAAQAMPNKGTLRVTLEQQENNARILIQDTGCGIPPENLKRIFDPFFTTKPEGEGTGLGLSVSYGILANHRGRIDVQSEVGSGTTFVIVLPVSQHAIPIGVMNT
jgi:two-component system NtrC family sensor kinase